MMMETITMEDCEIEKRDINYRISRESYGEESLEAEIEIIIQNIENIIREDGFSIKVVIDHEDITLGESQTIKIDSSYESLNNIYPIDFIVLLPYSPNDMKSISCIVSTPVLIKVYEVIEIVESVISTKSSKAKGKDKSSSELKRPSQITIETKLIGLCSIDLLPIVLGETVYDEKLVIEAPTFSWDNEAVPWANLPRLTVTLKQSQLETVMIDQDFNFLNITVECLHNLPLGFTEEMEYKCGTILQRVDNGEEESVEETRIIFEPGKWTDMRDVEQMKTWRSLQYLEGRARFSKYRINCDYDSVKNEYKCQFDLVAALKREDKRIEWNSVHRILLESKDIKNIQERLKKYKYWPFEIMVIDDPKPTGENGSGTIYYQCYADVSKLLFPGRTKARVLAQLHTQSLSAMAEKTGLNTRIFEPNDEFAAEPAITGRASKSSKLIVDGLDISIGGSDEEFMEESFPLFTETGEPVLILLEFELYQPFTPARVLEDFHQALEDLKRKPKPKRPFYAFTPDLVHDQYVNCIKRLVDTIGESYRDFIENCDCIEKEYQVLTKESKSQDDVKSSCKPPDPKIPGVSCPYFYIQDELSRFRQFLHESGKYVSIRNTLKNKVINLLDQKFAMGSSEWYSIENQNFVASCYSYLIEEMHIALNSKLDVRFEKKLKSEDYQELWFRAEEAYEFEDYEKADQLFTRIVSSDRQNPDFWIIYATFYIRREDIDEATECCRRAIQLDSRHKIALLFYGIILAMKEEYENAEVFLKSVTHFYPRFSEGWAVLHLLYVKIQYFPGIDLALEFAEKCLKDRVRESGSVDILKREPMAWSTMLCRDNRIFLLTTVLLIKLHLYSFAALALAQDSCHFDDNSVELLYFLSVNCYLQGSYATALEYLSEAHEIIGLEYSVSALTGHCLYKQKKVCEAIDRHYEAVDMMYDRPEDIHLVHLRMGFFFIEDEDYERARNIFLRAAKHSATCKTWLGVGISSYHLEKFEESEIALREANRIDCEDPEVWAYLCLLSMALKRYDEFSQCYRQMVKNNLRSDKLWRLIKHSMDTLGYSSPIAVFEDFNERCIC